MTRHLLRAAAPLAVVISASCAWSAEAQREDHLRRADEHFAAEEYREAILEYLNVLKLSPGDPHATARLGLSHFALGEVQQAYGYLAKARELGVEDADVRIRLGTLLVLTHKLDDARTEALAVLEKEPRNVEALTLLAEAAISREEMGEAMARLEEARNDFPEPGRVDLVLGKLHQKLGDFEAAEAAFRAGIGADDTPEAHGALGALYAHLKRIDDAERQYRRAAELAEPASAFAMELADFLDGQGRSAEARPLLERAVAADPTYQPAWTRLAELAFEERRYDDALAAAGAVLERSPRHRGSLLVKARVHLARRETDQAQEALQKLLEQYPNDAEVQIQMARVHTQAGNPKLAEAALARAVELAPERLDAQLALAEMNRAGGAPEVAAETYESLVQRLPGNAQLHESLGQARLEAGDAAGALESFQKARELAPERARSAYGLGLALAKLGRRDEARRAFETALELNPSYVAALARVLDLDVAAGQASKALARLEKQRALAPGVAGFEHMRGRLLESRGDRVEAEAAFRAALELDPAHEQSRADLAQLLGRAGRYDETIALLDAAPEETVSGSLLMLKGLAQQARGRMDDAIASYERALELEPDLAPAANNLAALYAEQDGQMEKALQLAQDARERHPDDPVIASTLGAILRQRGVYQSALQLLEESARKLPDNAEVQLQLGLTRFALEQREEARAALEKALALDPDVKGAEEARRLLGEMSR